MIATAGSLNAQSPEPRRGATPATLCGRYRAIGLGAGAAAGGVAALMNFGVTAMAMFTVPSSQSAPARATVAGALLGASAGLMQADATDSCRRTDGSVRETASTSTRLIEPGVRVRVRVPAIGPERVTRWVVDRRADTVVLASKRAGLSDTVSVALDEISQLDVARARGVRVSRHVLAIGLLGATIGGVVGYNQAVRDRSCLIVCDARPLEEAYFGAFDGLVAGAAVGLFLDRRLSSARWARVPLSRSDREGGRLGVQLVPARGGMTLAVSLH
jgi:hypothetical protein